MTEGTVDGDLEEALNTLDGKTCWSVVAGGASGSVVSLDFGEKIPRERPLRNPELTEDQRLFKGESSLFVECDWRLETEQEVLCSSTDPVPFSAAVLASLDQMVDRRIVGIEVAKPGWDVGLRFEGALHLSVFCSETGGDERDNYSLLAPYRALTVGAFSKVRQS